MKLKNILLITLVFLSIKGFGQKQKADSVIYCQVWIGESGSTSTYRYTIWQANYDGSRTSIEAKDCDNPLAPFGKLGAEGWHIVTSYKGNEYNGMYYMLEKTYKKK